MTNTVVFQAQRIKHLPAMQETRVPSLGWDDPLEKEMTTHSSILIYWNTGNPFLLLLLLSHFSCVRLCAIP